MLVLICIFYECSLFRQNNGSGFVYFDPWCIARRFKGWSVTENQKYNVLHQCSLLGPSSVIAAVCSFCVMCSLLFFFIVVGVFPSSLNNLYARWGTFCANKKQHTYIGIIYQYMCVVFYYKIQIQYYIIVLYLYFVQYYIIVLYLYFVLLP